MSQYLQVCLFFVFLFFAEGSLSQMASGAEDGESVVFSSQESMVGINDDSTTGGMAAYKAAGLDESALTAMNPG